MEGNLPFVSHPALLENCYREHYQQTAGTCDSLQSGIQIIFSFIRQFMLRLCQNDHIPGLRIFQALQVYYPSPKSLESFQSRNDSFQCVSLSRSLIESEADPFPPSTHFGQILDWSAPPEICEKGENCVVQLSRHCLERN